MIPTTLGKRKRIARTELSRASPSPSPSIAPESGDEDIQAIFRRAFEAKFKPLAVEPKKTKMAEKEEEKVDEDEDEESDWSGISSSSDEGNNVEVIEYSATHDISEKASRAELRAFMSSKPPKPASISTLPNSKAKHTDGPTETVHLKNDLALQRLLRDSHLLSAVSSSSTATTSSTLNPPNPLTLTGSLRHKSTDLHLLSLGAKSSIHHQKNMPLPERRANAAKAKALEEKRRSEARENGIVLEKE
ncbi:hypothetical protein K505DRAFT_340661, partial [Melanomma pulvis-pyrius CBS 109.77]